MWLLTIWKVEHGWTLWKTWAVNSNNKTKFPHTSRFQSVSQRMPSQWRASQHWPCSISWAGALTRKGTLNLQQKSKTHSETKSSYLLKHFLRPIASSLAPPSSLLLTTMRWFGTSTHMKILLKIQTVNRNKVSIVIFNSWFKSDCAAFVTVRIRP